MCCTSVQPIHTCILILLCDITHSTWLWVKEQHIVLIIRKKAFQKYVTNWQARVGNDCNALHTTLLHQNYSLPPGTSLVVGIFQVREIGLLYGGWCNGVSFTEVSELLEIFAEQNMTFKIQITHWTLSSSIYSITYSKTPDIHKIVSTPLEW